MDAEPVDWFLTLAAINHRSAGKPSSDSPSLADGLPLLRPVGPEREMVAALLRFVACGLTFGSTLDEMEAVALDELERARKLAAKQQRYRWIIPPTTAEEAAEASSRANAAAS